MKKRFGIRLGLLLAAVSFIGLISCGKSEEEHTKESGQESTVKEGEILRLWYSDAALDTYFTKAAESYEQEHGISVVLNKVSAINYLEAINQKNIEEAEVADVYVLNSELLEKAYQAGLALDLPSGQDTAESYPAAALSACVYKGKQVAYPLCYEVAFFLYNKNFVSDAPESFQAIIDFASAYGETEDVYEGIEMLLKWDVEDIFYNYGFFGAYLNLGGENGDDRSVVEINNAQVIEALTFYKMLNQSMYFDAEGNTYDSILEDFLEGKILYTIAGTKSLKILEEAQMPYGIAPLPALNASLISQGAAVNTLIAVNPYTDQEEAAKEFARYLADEYAEHLYAYSGYLPSKGMQAYPREEFADVQRAYERSAQLPKLKDISNFWVVLEVAVNNIWNAELPEEDAGESFSEESQNEDDGADDIRREQTLSSIREIVKEQINQVQQQMESQLR